MQSIPAALGGRIGKMRPCDRLQRERREWAGSARDEPPLELRHDSPGQVTQVTQVFQPSMVGRTGKFQAWRPRRHLQGALPEEWYYLDRLLRSRLSSDIRASKPSERTTWAAVWVAACWFWGQQSIWVPCVGNMYSFTK